MDLGIREGVGAGNLPLGCPAVTTVEVWVGGGGEIKEVWGPGGG